MNPQTVLEIVKLSLELSLEVIKGIPVESRQAMWKDHEQRVQFWLDLFAKLQADTP